MTQEEILDFLKKEVSFHKPGDLVRLNTLVYEVIEVKFVFKPKNGIGFYDYDAKLITANKNSLYTVCRTLYHRGILVSYHVRILYKINGDLIELRKPKKTHIKMYTGYIFNFNKEEWLKNQKERLERLQENYNKNLITLNT